MKQKREETMVAAPLRRLALLRLADQSHDRGEMEARREYLDEVEAIEEKGR